VDADKVSMPASVPLRYVPPEVPDAPPDVVEVLCRREAAVTVNGHRLRLIEPPFRFYADLLKALIGSGNVGLLSRVMTALRAVAAKGQEAEVEAALLSSLIGESADFVCDFLARLLVKSNTGAELRAACDILAADSEMNLADWLADNVPAAGMCGLLSAALYVCDVATLRGFFVQAAGAFRRKAKT
jgi:hypothetical protein